MFVAWVLWAAGCSSTGGDVAHEAREGAPFDRIRVSDSLDVAVEVADAVAVMAVAEASILPRVRTTVSDGELQIGVDGSTSSRSPARVEVGAPAIRVIQLEGSGDAEVALLSGTTCLISVVGSGDVVIDKIACDALSIQGSGSGDVEIGEGTVTALDIDLKGSGSAELPDVVAHHVRASTAGSGDIEVRAEGGIDATSTGSGDVWWSGPAEGRIAARGSGDVGHRQ